MSKKKVVITGSNGFIGKNLRARLDRREDIELQEITRSVKNEDYSKILKSADIVFHLAGVNRPENVEEFFEGNFDLTKAILEALPSSGCKFIFSSSIHAEKDNAYGKSKREAEEIIEKSADEGNIEACIYRLPGVFGKWCKPNYNSVVATFCYNIANGKDVRVEDPIAEVQLVYIDDVVEDFISLMDEKPNADQSCRQRVSPIYTVTVQALANKIKGFSEMRPNLYLPEVLNGFEKKLYSTYLSYLPENDFSYDLEVYKDDRGRLFEWIKSEALGQVFISDTKPGVTRGNHYHHTKTEKFLVIQGEAKIRFRQINSEKVIEYTVSGSSPEVVDIPPGYTHNLTNIGDRDMITLFWANEIFDEDNPDTTYEDV